MGPMPLDIAGYETNAFAVPPLLTGTLCLLLGLATLIRERGSKESWSFLGLCLAVWLWLVCFAFMYLATDPAVAYWWAKSAYLGIPCIAPATYEFATRVLGIRGRRRWLVRGSWVVFGGFVVAFLATDWLVGSLHLYPWGFYPRLEPAALAFVLPFVGVIGLALWEFRRTYGEAETETERLRAHAFLVGFATADLALLDYLPGFGVEIYPVGFVPVMAFLGIAATAIWRYRLADLTPAFIADRLVRTMPEMLIVCDARERVRLVNPAVSRVLRHDIESLAGERVETLADDGASRREIRELLRREVAFDRRVSLRARDGGAVPASVSASELRDDHGHRVGSVIVARDLRERTRMQKELVRRAFFDEATGLPNRTLLLERVQGALAHGRSRGTPFSLVCVEIDEFDGIVASVGLEAADGVLRRVGRRLVTALRGSDTVARIDGALFALLLRYVSSVEEALRVVGRIQDALGAPLEVEGGRIHLSASFGIALSQPGYEEAGELLRDARTALGRARERGRRQVEVFETSLRSRASRRLTLESELRRALAEGEFELRYQPIVSLDDGEVRAWEALLRWLHPERGLLEPGRFLGTAEETGLLVEIGTGTLRGAVRQLTEWEAADGAGPTGAAVHVNLSSPEFGRAGLVGDIERLLEETGLAGDRMVLELTETTLMERTEQALRTMRALKAAGVRFALDDFGTGYSSLAYLHRFPVDIVKIDRSFVRGRRGRGDAEIVRAIVDLGRSLGLEVIAEGIETGEQLARLRKLGCRYGQGNHLAPPVEATEATEALRRRIRERVTAGRKVR